MTPAWVKKLTHNGEYWTDAQGRLVPENMVKDIDKLREQLVIDLVVKAKALSAAIEDFKAIAFADIAAFIETSAEQYDVKLGGKKGNVTLVSYSGQYKIVRAIQDTIVFDEQLQAAKQLIDDCVQQWGHSADPKIQVLVNDAFQVGKEGKINTGRVLGLKRINITDEKWLLAMKAIGDSVRVAASKPYIRFYERVGDTDEYRSISLDMAAL